MTFVIAQYTNLSNEQNSWINSLSIELKSFFEDRMYGNDLEELHFGLITIKPEFDQFYKKKRPRYRRGSRTTFVDGIEVKSNNCVEIDCKIEFFTLSKLDRVGLIEKVCEALLTESNCLVRLSKLKDFDFNSFRSDLENHMIEKRYIKR